MHKARSLSVLSTVLLLVACQGGADDPELAQEPIAPAAAGPAEAAAGLEGRFPPEFDPCDFISVAEASAAAGGPVRDPESEISRFGIATCTFDPVDGLLPPVVLEVRPSDGAFHSAREMAEAMAADQGETIEMLDGVGERAFYSIMLGHNIVLAAAGRYANLIVRQDTQVDNREQAIDLARKVGQRLR